jgi:hypothetical protein
MHFLFLRTEQGFSSGSSVGIRTAEQRASYDLQSGVSQEHARWYGIHCRSQNTHREGCNVHVRHLGIEHWPDGDSGQTAVCSVFTRGALAFPFPIPA